jgi:hypothetical protein
VCDTLCVLGDGVSLFAKNSDRPVSEAQVARSFPRRPAGGRLRTQYIELPDTGAAATVLSQPVWLWGAEHGVNEHGVAIGNEMVDTVDDPAGAPPALIGMDLVRLGLERARSAEEAVDVITTLLERHGQGGLGDQVNAVAYWSSFLMADPASAWVLETSGSRWAARPLGGGGAISNRLTLRADWTRAAPGVAAGTDLDSWRDPAAPTGFADSRLAAGNAFVRERPASSPARCDPRAAVAHLRDHGTGPWGAPGGGGPVVEPPASVEADGTGITVCMHIRDFEATTASMVAVLSAGADGATGIADAARPGRAWVALGSPCASVFVPVLLPSAKGGGSPSSVAPALGERSLARRLVALSRAAEAREGALASVRAVLDPIEAHLWEEAEGLAPDPASWDAFAGRAERRLVAGLDSLAAAGLGVPA